MNEKFNFSKIPNDFCTIALKETFACTKVVAAVLVETYLKNKESADIDYPTFVRLTGMSTTGVNRGLKIAMKKKYILRKKSARPGHHFSFSYNQEWHHTKAFKEYHNE